MYPTLGKGQRALAKNEGPSPCPLVAYGLAEDSEGTTLRVPAGSCRAQAVSMGGSSLKGWQEWGKSRKL